MRIRYVVVVVVVVVVIVIAVVVVVVVVVVVTGTSILHKVDKFPSPTNSTPPPGLRTPWYFIKQTGFPALPVPQLHESQ